MRLVDFIVFSAVVGVTVIADHAVFAVGTDSNKRLASSVTGPNGTRSLRTVGTTTTKAIEERVSAESSTGLKQKFQQLIHQSLSSPKVQKRMEHLGSSRQRFTKQTKLPHPEAQSSAASKKTQKPPNDEKNLLFQTGVPESEIKTMKVVNPSSIEDVLAFEKIDTMMDKHLMLWIVAAKSESDVKGLLEHISNESLREYYLKKFIKMSRNNDYEPYKKWLKDPLHPSSIDIKLGNDIRSQEAIAKIAENYSKHYESHEKFLNKWKLQKEDPDDILDKLRRNNVDESNTIYLTLDEYRAWWDAQQKA